MYKLLHCFKIHACFFILQLNFGDSHLISCNKKKFFSLSTILIVCCSLFYTFVYIPITEMRRVRIENFSSFLKSLNLRAITALLHTKYTETIKMKLKLHFGEPCLTKEQLKENVLNIRTAMLINTADHIYQLHHWKNM